MGSAPSMSLTSFLGTSSSPARSCWRTTARRPSLIVTTSVSRCGGGRITVNRGRSTAVYQEQMEVGLLPGARRLVAGEAPLRGAELGPVHGAAAVAFEAGREDLVEHLVEDDHLDEVARHALVIEGGMNADDLVVVEVHAHLDGALAPRDRAPPPADARAHLAAEVARVQLGVDVRQVVHLAVRRERRLGDRAGGGLKTPGLPPTDVVCASRAP